MFARFLLWLACLACVSSLHVFAWSLLWLAHVHTIPALAHVCLPRFLLQLAHVCTISTLACVCSLRFLLWLEHVCTIPALACMCLPRFLLQMCFCLDPFHEKKDTMSEINGLGPFDVHSLKRDVVADMAIDQKAPMMVVSEVNGDGETVRAVVTQKDLRIVCVGCFKEGMTRLDASRCSKRSSFVKHWDATEGRTETSAVSTCVGVDQ